MIQETLPNSYRDLAASRQVIGTPRQVVEDLPQAHRSLSSALDMQYRDNPLLDSTEAVVDVEHSLKSAQAAPAAAATKANIAVEDYVVLYILDLAGPACTPEAAQISRAC